VTTALTRFSHLAAPGVTKLAGTILDVASIQEGIAYLEPEAQYETFNCLAVDSVATWPCPPGAPVTKEFSAPEWIDGFRFAVYGGLVCKSFGFTLADGEAALRQAFANREHLGIEHAFMNLRFTGTEGGSAATDLTPAGGAVDVAVGVAMLEQDAAANYAGVPTLHMGRDLSALLWSCQLMVQNGQAYYTKQGSKVAAGGGYGSPSVGPTGADAAAGEAWIYGSGEVSLARSDILTAQDINRDTNEEFVLAERAYVASVDCYLSAVRVKIA
jgi:hypothetical protein